MKIRRVGPVEYNIVRFSMLMNIWWIGCKVYKNPITSLKTVRKLIQRFTKMMGKKKMVRAYKLDGKYNWDMFNPAWPSPGFDAFFRSHLLEENTTEKESSSIRRLIIAITKRCPLQCEHCSEAATLYKKDVLSYNQLVDKIDPFVDAGIGQLVLSGGEPLSRFDDLIKILNRYKSKCDQWLYTSAFGLTYDKALLLKKAGLNGAAISLDHHIEKEHNLFRGNKKSYFWVLEGIKNLQKAGVLVSINVCPTKEYIEQSGPESMIALAKELEIPIVNFLEPRAVGNYQSKDVELHPVHFDRLASLSEEYNFDKNLFDSPTVLFPAAYRKSTPCGGGVSYIFLDYDGTLYPCPFCKVKMPEVKSDAQLCVAS